MKKILSLLVFLPLFSAAQNTVLSGKWVEVHRGNRNGMSLPFADSVHLRFFPGRRYSWERKGGFLYQGGYKIMGSKLDMGARYFRIVSHTPERLVLDEDGLIQEFIPDAGSFVSTLPDEEQPVPVADIGQMAGKWSVYKRTNAGPKQEVDYQTLVRSVTIFDRADAEGNLGWIAGSKDPDNMHSWNIIRFDHGRLSATGRSGRVFEVLKTQNDLVLREGDITYFLKNFK